MGYDSANRDESEGFIDNYNNMYEERMDIDPLTYEEYLYINNINPSMDSNVYPSNYYNNNEVAHEHSLQSLVNSGYPVEQNANASIGANYVNNSQYTSDYSSTTGVNHPTYSQFIPFHEYNPVVVRPASINPLYYTNNVTAMPAQQRVGLHSLASTIVRENNSLEITNNMITTNNITPNINYSANYYTSDYNMYPYGSNVIPYNTSVELPMNSQQLANIESPGEGPSNLYSIQPSGQENNYIHPAAQPSLSLDYSIQEPVGLNSYIKMRFNLDNVFISNNFNVTVAYNNIISDKYSTDLDTKKFARVNGVLMGEYTYDVKNRLHLCIVAIDYIDNSINNNRQILLQNQYLKESLITNVLHIKDSINGIKSF